MSHDYVIVQPDYYAGMRSFGRDWQQMQPGSLISQFGENLSVSPCPPGAACVRPRNIHALHDLLLFQGSIASIASPSIANLVLIIQHNRPYARPVCVPILAILRILSLKIACTAEKLLRRPGGRFSAL